MTNYSFLLLGLRFKLNITQKGLSELLGFKSHCAINKIENGEEVSKRIKSKIQKLIKNHRLNQRQLEALGSRIVKCKSRYKDIDFSTLLKCIRKKLNVSQHRLGKKLGVSQGTLALAERRKRIPYPFTLYRFEILLKTNLIDNKLLFEDKEFLHKRLRIDENTIPKRSSNLSNEKVRIIGHCMFDGSVNLTKCNKLYEIGYSNKNEVLIQQFNDDIFKVYGFSRNNRKVNNKDVPQLSYRSKEAYFDLLKYSKSFSTKNTNCSIPKSIEYGSVEYRKVFLRSFFDDEGWCYIYKGGNDTIPATLRKSCVCGACENSKIRKQLINILKGFNIIAYDIPSDGRIRIHGRQNIMNFAKYINFTQGVKAQGDSRYWSGIEKREILNKLTHLTKWRKNEPH